MVDLFPTPTAASASQLAYYEPSRNIFIWVLQYDLDQAGDNEIRVAVANGAGGLASNTWRYWDLTPSQIGLGGDNYDQPKIGVSSNYAYIEISAYSSAPDGGYLLRLPLTLTERQHAQLQLHASDTRPPAPVLPPGRYRRPPEETTFRLYGWRGRGLGQISIPSSSYPDSVPAAL